jgi:chaperone required for assembly of F1-ATPase
MREIFDDISKNEPLDPMEAARRNMRPNLRKRFYGQAGVEEGEGGFHVLLDGKPVRTPAKRSLAAPRRALAVVIAAEWDAQKDVIDPARMPLTRLANSIVDGVSDAAGAVGAEVAKYLGSDLVFYRAGEPERLVAMQAAAWDPLLAFARDELGARFVLAEGIVHVAQPRAAVEAARAAIPHDPWRLGAVHVVTTLTGSALIALALARGTLTEDEAWAAAHVDEDFQMQQWGRDERALERRALRRAEMQAAAKVLDALRREAAR